MVFHGRDRRANMLRSRVALHAQCVYAPKARRCSRTPQCSSTYFRDLRGRSPICGQITDGAQSLSAAANVDGIASNETLRTALDCPGSDRIGSWTDAAKLSPDRVYRLGVADRSSSTLRAWSYAKRPR